MDGFGRLAASLQGVSDGVPATEVGEQRESGKKGTHRQAGKVLRPKADSFPSAGYDGSSESQGARSVAQIASAWKAGAAWLTARVAEMRLAIRVAVAAVLSFALAHVIGLAQGYWAVFTAVIVMQASIGGSLKATIDRLIGTLGGAIFGGAVAMVVPHGDAVALAIALALALLPLAFVAAVDARFRVAPVTAVIVLLNPVGQQANPITFTIDRIVEIGLGSVVALAVSLFILPARAHSLLAATTNTLLGLLAQFLEVLLAGLTGEPDKAAILRLQVASRRAITKLDGIADEARRERDSHLTDDADPDPIVRTATRLRNDLIIIARAAASRLPSPADERLASSLAGVASAGSAVLRGLAEAFATRTRPPSLEGLDAALRTYHMGIAALREEGVLRVMKGEDTSRVFAVGFALDQFRQNLGDLTDRAAEFARQEGGGPRPEPGG